MNIYAANTTAPELATEQVAIAALTVLKSTLPALAVFSTRFTAQQLKRGVAVEVGLVTAGSTTQVDPTTYQPVANADATIDAVPVTPHHISQPFQMSNADSQDGHRIEQITSMNTQIFAEKILDTAFAPITTANFGDALVTTAAATFGSPELRTLRDGIAGARIKNCVLDSTYYSRFLPSQLMAATAAVGMPGWNAFVECSRWDGAEANVRGFACSPNALAVLAGLPETDPPGFITGHSVVNIPLSDLGITVQLVRWFDNATRESWCSLDLMFGVAVGDPSALKILKSA